MRYGLRSSRATHHIAFFLFSALSIALVSCGGGGGYGGGGGGGPTIPSAPTGLAAAPGNAQVSLTWNASAGATSYNVKRSTTSGGPYATISSPAATSLTDTGLANGTAYYYVVSALNSAGESGNSAEVKATPNSPPPVPTGLTATAGNTQVNLAWTASTGATSYNVKRSTTTGGPYTTISSPAAASFTDTGLTNGTTYYYVVSAVNSSGESANSSEASAKPAAAATSVLLNVDVLSNRHPISSYVYGGSFPKDTATITDSGTTLVRWGGNATSRYNWKNFGYNSSGDYYFSDYQISGLGGTTPGGADQDSERFVRDVIAAGSNPLMTMVMLGWVAKDANNGASYSFSVAKYGPQCATRPDKPDAGNGLNSNCATSNPTHVTSNDPNDANVPIKDTPSSGDPAGTVYRSEWATALAGDFGGAPHFYDMDNEIDIWGGKHWDVHPNPSNDAELRDTFITEARALKGWDPQAMRFGPVSCCWYYYWNSAAGASDKSAHGNIDFLPWWLNEVYWSDLVAVTRSLDVFDTHIYTESNTASLTLAQKQALALRVTRDWWDPTYVSESWFGSSDVLNTDPVSNIAFRLPRFRALVNTNYPGTLLSATEWNNAFAGEGDFSTALSDADAYGILGRERLYAAARWTAPDPATPTYQALKLYRNYDGAHHTFGTLSVSATHNSDPNLFSTYAALDSAGTTLTVVVINKDPANPAQVQFALNGFTPLNFTSYSISQASPNSIVPSASQPWASTQTFGPYTATLLVIGGSLPTPPNAEWDLNPESIMAPAGGSVTLQPKLTSATGTVTLSSPVFDSGIASMNITGVTVTSGANGSITVTAGSTPGFYHFTITGTDGSGVAQKQGGWIVVNNPAAMLAKTAGDAQTGTHGTALPLNLTVTLTPGASGGSATGASILFSTTSGTLSQRIVATDSSGKASVTLTLPASTGTVTVTAEGPFGLGHPVATFTETSN